MKKAYNRFGSVFTILLLAVFCAALLPPTATADDVFDVTDLIYEEAQDVADETPWVERSDPQGSGSWYMLARLPALLMDMGLLDIGGYTQFDSKSSNNCLKQDVNETQDPDTFK